MRASPSVTHTPAASDASLGLRVSVGLGLAAVRMTAVAISEAIRRAIRERDYYLSSHAEDEMTEDDFDRPDVEHAMLHGFAEKTMTGDSRGPRYRIEGSALDGRLMHVVCRFNEAGALVIITVYEKR